MTWEGSWGAYHNGRKMEQQALSWHLIGQHEHVGFVKFKKKQRSGWSNRITTQSILPCQQSNGSKIAQSQLPWSPKFPNMNPIKHLQNKVDWRFQLHEDSPLARMIFGKKLHEDRNNIEVEVLHKLVKLMSNVVQASSKAREAYTKN